MLGGWSSTCSDVTRYVEGCSVHLLADILIGVLNIPLMTVKFEDFCGALLTSFKR